MREDKAGGRLEIWNKCYESAPSKFSSKFISKPEFSSEVDCDSVSSHNVLIDTVTVQGALLLKFLSFLAIYGSYTYFFLKSIYLRNILALNLTILTSISSLFHNTLRDPINLLLFPIIFQLLDGTTKKSLNKQLEIQ